MHSRINPHGILFHTRSCTIVQPVIRNGFRFQHARHATQAEELLQNGNLGRNQGKAMVTFARSLSIRNTLFATPPQSFSTSTSDHKIEISADRNNEFGLITLASESMRLPWAPLDWTQSTPEWFDDLHYRDHSSPLGLSTLNAVFARLRRLDRKLSPRLLLYGVKVAIRAENPAAVRVYLRMFHEVVNGQPLTATLWRHFETEVVKSLNEIHSRHLESWKGSHTKQIWIEIITGLDVGQELGRAHLRKPSLYTLFPKGSPKVWEGYMNIVTTLRDPDLLNGEWVRFAQAELSNCAFATRSALSDDGGQIQLSISSATEQCAMADQPSETCLSDQYIESEKSDMKLGPLNQEVEDESTEKQKRPSLANRVMGATFSRLVSPLGDFDRAWTIAHQSDPIFGAIDAQNWARLLVGTDSFQRWTPKTNISMMELLKEIDQKSRDRPAPPKLVAAIEQLEADLGIKWMGAIDGHRMSDEREVGHFPGFEEQSDDILTEEGDEALKQLHKVQEKQHRADESKRKRVQIRVAKKQRLATELDQVDNLLRAFPLRDHQYPRQLHGLVFQEAARVPLR
jgi:hypothetical protein